MICACHWYSETPLTVIAVLVPVVVCAVQDSVPTLPHLTAPLMEDLSVPQLTITEDPTASVRYG